MGLEVGRGLDSSSSKLNVNQEKLLGPIFFPWHLPPINTWTEVIVLRDLAVTFDVTGHVYIAEEAAIL